MLGARVILLIDESECVKEEILQETEAGNTALLDFLQLIEMTYSDKGIVWRAFHMDWFYDYKKKRNNYFKDPDLDCFDGLSIQQNGIVNEKTAY